MKEIEMKEIKQQFQTLKKENKRVFVDKIVSAIEDYSYKIPDEIETKVEALDDKLFSSLLTNYQLCRQGKLSTVQTNLSDEFILAVVVQGHQVQAYYTKNNQVESFLQLLNYYRQGYLNLLNQAQWEDETKRYLKLFISYYFNQLEVSYFQLRLKNLSNKQPKKREKYNEDYQDEVKKQNERIAAKIEALYAVSHSLIDSENSTEVLKKIADVVAEALQIDRTYIFILDVENREVIDMVSGGRHEILEDTRAQVKDDAVDNDIFQELWEGLSGWVMRTGKPAFSPQGESDARESLRVRKRRKDTEAGDVIVVPLAYKGEMIGTLTGVNQSYSRSLQQKDVKLMTAMGNHAAVAIKNSRLLTRQKEEKEKFATLFKAANDAIVIHDLAGNVLEANQSACQQLGYSEQELLTLNLQEIPGLDYKENLDKNKAQLLANGELVFETVYYNQQQGTIYFEVNARLIEYEGERAVISIARDITDRKLEEKRLKQQANRDFLTGIYNRRAGKNFLQQKMVTCQQADQPLTLCFIDMDNLKAINDNYGHPAGDEAIVTIVEVIENNIRENDLICRVGGDEFLVIFPDSTSQQVKKVEERVLTKLQEINQSQKFDYQLEISCGIVEYTGQKMTAEELVEKADKKMYQEKKS